MCSRRTSGTESPLSEYSSGMPSPPTVIAPYNTPHEPYNQDGPYLKIIEQPQSKFRFRYKSEMIGTHGQLKAEAADKNRAKYPTVKLCNWYGGDALIRLTLFTGEANTNERKRHVHELSGKTVNQDTGVCEVPVSRDSNFEAVFQYLGIIHIAKRDVRSIIERRKFEDLVNHAMIRKTGLTREDAERNITQQDREKISKEAGDEANNIDLNKVVLRYQAFQGTPSGAYQPITMHLDSEYVYNLKNAWTGELKIVRMSAVSGPCTGNQEVFLLVEKVKKSNIKVKFIEFGQDGRELWSDYGQFSDNDVHHQYAIVFRTPKYRTIDLQEPIKVFVQLERTSDTETSEPREFTFLPVVRKRSLADTELTLTSSEGTVYDKENTRKRFRDNNMEPLDLRHYPTHRGPEDNINTPKVISDLLNSPFDYMPKVNAPQSNIHQVPSPGISDLGSPNSTTMYSPPHGVPVLSSSISQSINSSEYQLSPGFQVQYQCNNSPSSVYVNSPSPGSLSVPSPSYSTQQQILSSSPTEGASPSYVYSPPSVSLPSMTPSHTQFSTSPSGQQEYLPQPQQHHQPQLQQLSQQTILMQQPQQQLQQQPQQMQKTLQHQNQQYQLPQQQQQLHLQQQQIQSHQQQQAQQQVWSGSVITQQQQQPRQTFPGDGGLDFLELIGGDTSGPDLLDLVTGGILDPSVGEWNTDYSGKKEPKKPEVEGGPATGSSLVMDGASDVAQKLKDMTLEDKKTSSQSQARGVDVAFRVAVSAAECLHAYAATNDISLLLASHRYLLAVQNNQGDNALHTAVSNKNWDAFNKILKASEKVQPQDLLLNAQNFALETPLHLAVQGGEVEMVQRLMEVPGCNIAICNASGNTVLHEAAKQRDAHCLSYLLTRPTNGNRTALTQAVNGYNYHGETPLHMAVASGNLYAVRLLLGAGAQVHLCERKRGANALHIAVMCGQYSIAHFLIHHTNVTVEAGMFDGNTALHLAVQAEDKDMCRLLMRAKADPHAKNCLRKRTKTEDSDEESEDEDEEQQEKTGKEEEDVEDWETCTPLDYASDNAELVAILRGEEVGYVEAAAAAEAVPEKSKDYSDSANCDSGINISVTDVTPTNAYELNDGVRSRLASQLGGDSWRRLAERLDLEHLIPSLRTSPCPASQLLQLDSMKSISLQKLRDCLHKLGLKHCEAILDDL